VLRERFSAARTISAASALELSAVEVTSWIFDDTPVVPCDAPAMLRAISSTA
jgi:hypothetical protein